MSYKARIPKELFEEDGHYLGKPADFSDRIVHRRVKLVEQIPGFTGRDKSLLEIGCGGGHTMFLLSDKMKSCQGFEVTDEHFEDFTRLKEEFKATNCDYKIIDVVSSKPEKQYDRIISFEVIEHLSNEDGVSFYYDSLKDDGIMAISVPNKWWIFETHGANLPLLPWNRVPFFSWLPRPIHERFAHARIYTKKRIRTLLEQHGFEIMDIEYVTAPMDVIPDGGFKKWVIKTFFNSNTTSIPFKSTAIFVVARKRI